MSNIEVGFAAGYFAIIILYQARYSFDRLLGKKAVFMSFFRAKKRVFWYKMSKKRAFFVFFEAKMAFF